MVKDNELKEAAPLTTPEGRQWLIDHLKMGPVRVKFIKTDGSERIMNCTLEEKVIPVYEKSSDVTRRSPSMEVLPVYDLDEKDWRSFRLDSVLTISFTLQ